MHVPKEQIDPHEHAHKPATLFHCPTAGMMTKFNLLVLANTEWPQGYDRA